jgi:hypothetical protein
MKLKESGINCQVPCLQLVAEGPGEVPPESLVRRLKLAIRRSWSPTKERAFKNRTDDLINRFRALTGRETRPPAPVARVSSKDRVQAGDWVRVRSQKEIEATLNNWRQLKGCTFMPEQVPYCDTIHQVHKRMKQFVDERDLRVKKVSGIILLEGVRCQGTAEFGRCDRSCFYFWREEWLEKVNPPEM